MYTKDEALTYIQENDVKFIKLFFTDIFGSIKSLSIQPSELEQAFETGIPFDASAMRGFLNVTAGDLLLVPDPATLCVLPWRPQTGRVVRFFCTIRTADSGVFEGDFRSRLKAQVRELSEQGYDITIGTECEFYLLKLDETGAPTLTPQDDAGYCDLAPRDRGENVRRDICLTLEQMGVHPESSHHEKGAGQNEVDFRAADPLSSADNLVTFKTVVRTVADRSGLYASFLPKPLDGEPGSGLHVHIALAKDGKNLFAGELGSEARAFIAGVLRRIRELTVFLNPCGYVSGYCNDNQSYWRLSDYPVLRKLGWGYKNAGGLIRIMTTPGALSHFELRSPDPACNSYLAFYLILAAGFEGIRDKLPLEMEADVPLPVDEQGKAQYGDAEQQLPESADDARALAFGRSESAARYAAKPAVPESAFVCSLLGEAVCASFKAAGTWGYSDARVLRKGNDSALYYLL